MENTPLPKPRPPSPKLIRFDYNNAIISINLSDVYYFTLEYEQEKTM